MFYRALFMTALLFAGTSAQADHPSIGFGGGTAGPIVAIPAATLTEGRSAVSISVEFIRSGRLSDAQLANLASQHAHAHSTDWVLTSAITTSYGVTDDLSLSLRIPYVHRENIRAGTHSHGGGGPVNSAEHLGDAQGLGDIAVLGKYRVLKLNGCQAALLFGAELPTGRTGLRHGGEKLEAEQQSGSGSYDGLLGIAAGRAMGPLSLDASALYKLATKGAQETDLGDRLQYDLAISRRLGGERHDHGRGRIHHHRAFDLVLELNGEWAAKQRTAGETEENSGGNQVFLTPGLRYSAGRGWAAHLAVGVPVISSLGRGHPDTGYKVLAGVGKAF